MYVIEVPQHVLARQGGGLGYAATAAMPAAAAAGPAAPIVLAVATLVSVLLTLIKFGPSPYNVPAATAEQVFEAAADKLYAAAQDGMISVAEAVAGMRVLLQYGTQSISQLKLDGRGTAALANMTKVIQDEISAVQRVSSKVTKPIDVSAAAQYYPAPGASGWYSESIVQANELVAQYLQALPARQSSLTQLIPSELSISSVLPWAAAGLLAFKLFAGG